MSHYVYKFINFDNEIIYIGRTSTSIQQRMSEHFNDGHLNKDCYKEVKRIDYTNLPTKTESMIVEQYLINVFKPIYNFQYKESETIILKIDLSHLKWQTFTKNNKKNRPPLITKKIIQVSLEGEYIKEWESITDAAINVGSKMENISAVCRGKSFTSAGFRWFYKDEYIKVKDSIVPIRYRTSKPIIQFTLNNKIIRTWSSTTEASKTLGIKKNNISAACTGVTYSSGGFRWMFKDDYDNLKKKFNEKKVKH